jgi:hypothetical protein
MSWQIALIFLFLGILALVGVVFAIRDDRDTVIKNSELNAHRITPKFNVGSDAK